MTEQDFTEFSSLMELASQVTAMPNGKNVKEVTNALFIFLKKYPFEVVKCAVMNHCRENKFFPMLADIVNQIEGTAEERAAMAWSLILKAKKKYRLVKSIRFPNPAIHFAIERMGGWEHLYTYLIDEEEDFKAKIFATYYRIGEKIATWDTVCSYFASEVEIYAIRNRGTVKREVFNVETDMLIPENELPALGTMYRV